MVNQPIGNHELGITGFGELSFWWIQICIGSPMRRSSFYMPS